MADTARNEAISEPEEQIEQETPPIKPWKRQKGEPILWFNRFKRYRDLGYKRSLQAAVEQERAQIQALKSTNVEEKLTTVRLKRGQKGDKSGTVSPLREVQKPKSLQVPGSWRKASGQWQWVERARAWDNEVIDSTVEHNIDTIIEGVALGLYRVKALKSMLGALESQFNTNRNNMTYEQEFACIARMQSILRDIREEMSVYDEAVTRVIVRKHCFDLYKDMDKYTLDEIRAEQARRKQEGKVP